MFDTNDRQTHYFREVEKPGLLGEGVTSSEVIFVVVIIAAIAIMHRMSRRNQLYSQAGYGAPVTTAGLGRGAGAAMVPGMVPGVDYDPLLAATGSMRRRRELPRGDDRRLLTLPLDRRRDEFRRFRQRLRDKRERHRRERDIEKMVWAQRDGEEGRRKQMQRSLRLMHPVDAASIQQLMYDRDLLIPTDVPTIYTRDGFRHHHHRPQDAYLRHDPRYPQEIDSGLVGRTRHHGYQPEFERNPRGYGSSIRLIVHA